MAAVFRRFLFTVALATSAANAEAQGLSRARSTLQNFQSELMLFVPIVGGFIQRRAGSEKGLALM